MLCDDLETVGWGRGSLKGRLQEGRGICISIADSCCYTAEIHTRHCKAIILQLNKNTRCALILKLDTKVRTWIPLAPRHFLKGAGYIIFILLFLISFIGTLLP